MQQPVTGTVAQGVIDDLETVEIEKQYRQLCTAFVCTRQRMLDTIQQQRPVGQAGEHIVMRQVLKTILRFNTLGDVFSGGNEMSDFAKLILQRRNGFLIVIKRAIFFSVNDNVPKHLAAQYGVPQPFIKRVVMPPGVEYADLTTNGFLLVITGDRFESGINVLDTAAAVRNADGVSRLLQRHGQFAHPCFSLATFGGIAHDRHKPRHFVFWRDIL